jgi:hypothetical protein
MLSVNQPSAFLPVILKISMKVRFFQNVWPDPSNAPVIA